MLEIKGLQEIIVVATILIIIVFVYLFFRKFTTKDICPKCKHGKDLERIRKQKIFRYIPFTNMKRLKCHKCNKTHYQVQFKLYSVLVKKRMQ